MTTSNPVLSIGMIFKNEIRCLERCMKSLQPLRDALPCELVMADTGATDGSREVAEKYADLLFDFEWINDFAAARNAVIDRCRGEWFLTIDCDEWLDEDISGLVELLTSPNRRDLAAVTIRNYKTPELENGGDYSDFIATRMVRLSTGLRYEGAIHEHWPSHRDGSTIFLIQTPVFHHDGYLKNDPELTKTKNKRNMTLLREKLEKDPGSLVLLMQCIESDNNSEDTEDYVRRAVEGIQNRVPMWQRFGPPLLRYAVIVANGRKWPELEEWIELAESLFPDSIYTLLDVNFIAFAHYWGKEDYEECVRRGEIYLEWADRYRRGDFDRSSILISTLAMAAPRWELQLSVFLAGGYLYTGRLKQCTALLRKLDGTQFSPKHTSDCTRVLTHLRTRTHAETDDLIRTFWQQISTPVPHEQRAEQRKREFFLMGGNTLRETYRTEEEQRADYCRHAYTLFLPLAEKCDLGRAAAVLASSDPAEMETALSGVEDWVRLPDGILPHALRNGVCFPLKNRPMYVEEMDGMITRLAQDQNVFQKILEQGEKNLEYQELNLQQLTWIRGLALAAVRTFDWEHAESEKGRRLSRFFARVEHQFIRTCYAPQLLEQEEYTRVLPAMHRLGWYCAKAFEALDSETPLEYVRLLRRALEVCPEMKKMIEFLKQDLMEQQKQLREQRIRQAPPELLALAEQVRMVLAQYSPYDPAVVALKNSEAYQSVAFLIEDPTEGGIPQ